jgi:subfamily B ATP-binding cassette protein MsbA
MRTINKIIKLSKPYWKTAVLGIIFGLGVSGVAGAIAWLIKPALDVIFIEKKYEYLTLLPIGIFALFMIRGLLQFGQTYFMRSAGMQLVRDMQNRLHSHILRIPVSYFHDESSGVVISRVINDVKMLGSLFSEVIKTVVISIPTIIVLMAIALYRKWDLALLSITLLPLAAYTTRKIGKKIKKKTHIAQGKQASLTQRLSESIIGSKVIKVFNRENYRDEKFIEENKRVYKENLKIIKLKEITKVMIDITTGIAIGLILWYGGSQVKNGLITSGDFVSIIAAIYMIFSPAKKLGESYTFLQEIKAAIERIETVLHTEPEKKGGIKINDIKDGIRFENVTFSYRPGKRPVLKSLNLHIKAGEVIAIVGPSGAGKTTFADLIPRFYSPAEGSIKIDGVDLRDIDISSLRELIGIVSQDIVLFNDTVKENIAFGNQKATFDDIKKAAALAYADEFIERLPEGYNTIIGERGLKLSGGQRQRIAIARAILKNPPLLILDEATSSLDTTSEALVQKALEQLTKNRTTIVIAHRLSTIKNADRIVVIEDGQIRDIGTHEELLSKCGTYSRLCRDFVYS